MEQNIKILPKKGDVWSIKHFRRGRMIVQFIEDVKLNSEEESWCEAYVIFQESDLSSARHNVGTSNHSFELVYSMIEFQLSNSISEVDYSRLRIL